MSYRDPEKQKARLRAYYVSHKEELKARNAAYRAAHKEELKAKKRTYYEAHKEEKKARDRAYRATHKEEERANHRAYHAKHRVSNNKKSNARARRLAGIDPVAAEALLRNARWCEICLEEAKLVPDHKHRAHLRGALCWKCNTSIGHFKDSPAILRAAADYLERYSA